MNSPSQNHLKRLVGELHWRSLWQVLGIYAVGGWIAFEVVQTLTEGLGLPEWFPAFAIVLLLYQAAIRYRETSEPTSFDIPGTANVWVFLYGATGQHDRAIDLVQEVVRAGALELTAYGHVLTTSELLGDNPRYQALLEEAGITW